MSPSQPNHCVCCEKELISKDEQPTLCPECSAKSEELFDFEMRQIELLRTIRGRDVELYDIKYPVEGIESLHCGQIVIMKAGQGFEVKIWLRSGVLDWSARLTDNLDFMSPDTRLDALIGNITLLIESWGGGPHYMDIFYVDKVLSIEGEL